MPVFVQNPHQFIPSQAGEPVPPPIAQLPIAEVRGLGEENSVPVHGLPYFIDFLYKMWAAVFGASGISDTVTITNTTEVRAEVLALQDELSRLAAQVSNSIAHQVLERDVIIAETLALIPPLNAGNAALAGALDAALGDVGTTGVWAPMVTGETPGPVPIANVDGTFIMVKVED